MDFRLLARKLGQYPAEAERLLAKLRAHPVVAGGGGIALVEDQVDDRKHGRQPGREFVPVRNLERHILLAQGPFGADDPLSDGRLRDQERTRDLVGRQSAKQAQRERDARFGGKHRVAGGEHKAQEIVANLIVERGIEIGLRRLLLNLKLITELLMLSFEQLVAAEKIDRSMLRGGHEPGAGIVRDARLWPLIERCDEGLLREVLGYADVAHHAGETGDQLRLLDPPDCIDSAVYVGSRHGYRLTHFHRCRKPRYIAAASVSWLGRTAFRLAPRSGEFRFRPPSLEYEFCEDP